MLVSVVAPLLLLVIPVVVSSVVLFCCYSVVVVVVVVVARTLVGKSGAICSTDAFFIINGRQVIGLAGIAQFNM